MGLFRRRPRPTSVQLSRTRITLEPGEQYISSTFPEQMSEGTPKEWVLTNQALLLATPVPGMAGFRLSFADSYWALVIKNREDKTSIIEIHLSDTPEGRTPDGSGQASVAARFAPGDPFQLALVGAIQAGAVTLARWDRSRPKR